MLDNSDVGRILPYYFFDYRMSLRAKEKALSDDETEKPQDDNIVIRNGKKYRKTTADKASWADSIF